MKKNLPFKDILSVLDDYDLFLFDLWGVIIEGEILYEGVVEKINQIIDKKKQVFFISNAPRPALYSHDRIKSWGINIGQGMVITSGEIAREYINNSKVKFNIENPIIYHLGSDRNQDIAENLRCKITKNIKEANILLISAYRDLGEDLEEFDELLKLAIELNLVNICANPDVTIPRQESIRYNAGYFASKIEKFGGNVFYTGKPYSEIYSKILIQFPHINKKRILMIGDTLETDILGANRISIDSALVMSGNAKKFHIQYKYIEDKVKALSDEANKVGIIPTFITKL